MMRKHFTIPVFIPMEACPFHCIYCDQVKISGTQDIPTVDEIKSIVEAHLTTMPSDATIEVGFFGGTFTGLPPVVQEKFLLAVQPFIDNGRIRSIRLSTRPDQIGEQILSLLKNYPVETIELGAQSMDDEVLRRSGRGHKAADTINAAKLIREQGFRLGLQMMIGLPGDNREKCLTTAREFVSMKAKDVRIYPTLVIRGTPLEKLFLKKTFQPLSLEKAVAVAADVTGVFADAGVNIIRMGLHPSEGLLNGDDLVAGPFHVSFRELVMTEIWRRRLVQIPTADKKQLLLISVPPGQLNYAVGYRAANRKFLEKQHGAVKFSMDPSLKNQEFHVGHC